MIICLIIIHEYSAVQCCVVNLETVVNVQWCLADSTLILCLRPFPTSPTDFTLWTSTMRCVGNNVFWKRSLRQTCWWFPIGCVISMLDVR